MGALNYSNLGDRVQEAKDNEENKGKPFEEGKFNCVFRAGELGKSREKNNMFILEWRANAPGNKRMHRETLKQRFVVTKNTTHQVDQFLVIMDQLGVDFSKLKRDRDWDDIFEDLEEERVKVVIEIYFRDDDKDEDGNPKKGAYAEMRMVEVLKAMPGTKSEKEEVEEEEKPKAEKPKAKPKATAAEKKAAEDAAEQDAVAGGDDEPEDSNDDSGSDSDDDW